MGTMAAAIATLVAAGHAFDYFATHRRRSVLHARFEHFWLWLACTHRANRHQGVARFAQRTIARVFGDSVLSARRLVLAPLVSVGLTTLAVTIGYGVDFQAHTPPWWGAPHAAIVAVNFVFDGATFALTLYLLRKMVAANLVTAIGLVAFNVIVAYCLAVGCLASSTLVADRIQGASPNPIKSTSGSYLVIVKERRLGPPVPPGFPHTQGDTEIKNVEEYVTSLPRRPAPAGELWQEAWGIMSWSYKERVPPRVTVIMLRQQLPFPDVKYALVARRVLPVTGRLYASTTLLPLLTFVLFMVFVQTVDATKRVLMVWLYAPLQAAGNDPTTFCAGKALGLAAGLVLAIATWYAKLLVS